MFKSLLFSSIIFVSQLPNTSPEFRQLKTQLESYGFKVNIAIPPDFTIQGYHPYQTGLRRSFRRSMGLFRDGSIWINPIAFELDFGKQVLIHEAVHAVQYCIGKDNVEKIGLNIEPIPQALPYFKIYADNQRQDLEREAYTVQSQPNSYKLVKSLLERHCKK